MTSHRKIPIPLAVLYLLVCFVDHPGFAAAQQYNSMNNLYVTGGNRQPNKGFKTSAEIDLGPNETIGEYGLPEMAPEFMENICKGASRADGGQFAGWSEAPFMVSIRDLERDRRSYGGGHLCGGTLISPYLVLTTASCTRAIPQERMGIVMGTLNRKKTAAKTTQLNFVTAVLEHPSFSEEKARFDIALLVLKVAAPIGKRVKPAKLAAGDPKPGRSCMIHGWGQTVPTATQLPDCLEKASVVVQSQESCTQQGTATNMQLPMDMVCAETSTEVNNVCSGDVGGPLVCNGVVHGIATSRAGCGDRKMPEFYTGVSRYRYWIKQTIQDRLKTFRKDYPRKAFDVQFK